MSSISGHAISSGLHNARLLDLLYLLSGCWTMLTSCQGACCPLKHIMLFGLAFKMLHCVMWSASCYVASPQALPPVACCFNITFLFSGSLIWFSRCYAVWPSLPHATLLDLTSFMLCGFKFNKSCMLLDLGFITLGCWILFASCYGAWSSLPPAMLLELLSVMFSVCFCLHDRVMLFGFVFMMRCCLASLHHALLPRACVLSTQTYSWNHKFFAFGISSVTSYLFLVPGRPEMKLTLPRWDVQNCRSCDGLGCQRHS